MSRAKFTYINGKKVGGMFLNGVEIREMYYKGDCVYHSPDYEVVNFIQMKGDGHIDTGVSPVGFLGTEIKLSNVANGSSSSCPVMGAEGVNRTRYTIWKHLINISVEITTNQYNLYSSGRNKIKSNTPTDLLMKPDNKIFIGGVEDVTVPYDTGIIEGSIPTLWLWGLNHVNGNINQKGNFKLYKFKITTFEESTSNIGVVLIDAIPVKRKSDGVYGLYDRVTEKFITSENGTVYGG